MSVEAARSIRETCLRTNAYKAANSYPSSRVTCVPAWSKVLTLRDFLVIRHDYRGRLQWRKEFESVCARIHRATWRAARKNSWTRDGFLDASSSHVSTIAAARCYAEHNSTLFAVYYTICDKRDKRERTEREGEKEGERKSRRCRLYGIKLGSTVRASIKCPFIWIKDFVCQPVCFCAPRTLPYK